MATASTFSYAQAAKGQGALQPTTSPNPAPQPPQPQATAPPAATETRVESSDAPRESEPRAQAATEKLDVDSNIGSEIDLRSETTHDRCSESRRDDDAATLDRPWRQADKGTRSSSTATRSVDDQEARKPRKGKKSKTPSDKQSHDQTSASDKTKEVAQEAPKVELSEAPIPPVNVWLQRKEQQAKVTSNGTTVPNETRKPTMDSSASSPTPTAPKENAPTNATTNASTTAVKPIRKSGGDPGRSDRNGSRGSRLADKDGKSDLPPSVEDAASWPTPEIAIKEELKKPAATRPVVAQEKESQEDGSQGKRQKEKWVTYEYVPSVNFETQLPQMRNSKSRGAARAVNSGRAASTSSSQPSEKTATANMNTSTNASKSTESKERTRESTAGSTRTTSLPPASKRATMDVSNATKEQKKGAQSGGEKARDTTISAQSSATQQQQQQPQQQQHPQQQHQPLHHQHHHASNARSEGRTERGRGGYRGRGAHHSINSHSHQHNGTGFSNNGSISGRPQGPYSPPLRQGSHSQGFVPPSHRGGRARNGAGNNFHRMSLPNGVTRLPPIQATFGGSYEYPMHPMTAIPFQQPLQYWDNMVIGVLKNQIEYYFSIENLCKDMYLRKRMDSQGFVHLHFVAAFKRIRELTQDMAMIRAVCETSSEIDFAVGEDDVERIRRRNGWQSFVLPMEDRDDFARNGGPSQLTFKNRPLNSLNFGPQYNGLGPLSYGMVPQMGYSSPGGAGQFHHFPEGASASAQSVNGTVDGHGSTPLSANVPDFSPSGSAAFGAHGQGSIHGHTLQNSNAIVLTNGVHAE
ncbi:hypothetical protein E4U41_002601 [Claviceps citrina]|nr:hypothetical protein E4U41_002601 [Claviceps citrina]